MRYSLERFTGAFGASTVIAILLIYLMASSIVVASTLSVVGIGGLFMTADTLRGEHGIIYPEMGSPDGTDLTTDSVACEERPMLAINLQSATIDGYSIYKDIKLPFVSDRWVTIFVEEPNGRLVSDSQITLFNTQLEANWLNITNVELTEGGMPYQGVTTASDLDDINRANDYEPPDNLGGDATGPNPNRPRSTQIWGPNSGEFLMLSDPQDATTDGVPDAEIKGAKAWVHGITGESVRFIAGGTATTIGLRYNTTTELEARYDSIGVDTRDPASYNRTPYFDCLPTRP